MDFINWITITLSLIGLTSLPLLTFFNRKKILNEFSKISSKVWISFLVLVIASAFLRFFWILHAQVVYSDGFLFVNIARTLRDFNVNATCAFVSDGVCEKYHYSFYWPPVYPLMLSLVFRVFDYSESLTFNFSALLGTISVFISFFLAYIWTKKEVVALVSAALFSLTPVLLKFSGGPSLVFPFLIFSLLATLFFELFLETKDRYIFLLFLSALLCAIYTRIEGFLLIFVFAAGFLIREECYLNIKKSIGSFFKKKFYRNSLAIYLLVLIPIFATIYNFVVRHPLAGWTPGALETLNYFLDHSSRNIRFLLEPQKNLLISSFLIVLGAIYSLVKKKKEFISFTLFFIGYFTLYSSFDMGDMLRGSNVKYSMILFVPLFYFLSMGIELVGEKISRVKLSKLITFLILISLAGASFMPTINFIQDGYDDTTLPFRQNRDKFEEFDYILGVTLFPYIVFDIDSVNTASFLDNENYFKNKNVGVLKTGDWYLYDGDNLKKIEEKYQFEEVFVIGEISPEEPIGLFRMKNN